MILFLLIPNRYGTKASTLHYMASVVSLPSLQHCRAVCIAINALPSVVNSFCKDDNITSTALIVTSGGYTTGPTPTSASTSAGVATNLSSTPVSGSSSIASMSTGVTPKTQNRSSGLVVAVSFLVAFRFLL